MEDMTVQEFRNVINSMPDVWFANLLNDVKEFYILDCKSVSGLSVNEFYEVVGDAHRIADKISRKLCNVNN